MFLIPALLVQGLLKSKEVYSWPSKTYYSLESIVLTLALMALLRIKHPEQLKQCKPGEIGRIIGLDRIPEVKCLRRKIWVLSEQNKAKEFNNLLVDYWYRDQQREQADFLYIDGHVRIYYGGKANLPAKYISRQKLCLSATTEYWVNDAHGMPVMMVMGELTEKLQQVIEQQIIPQLQQTRLLSHSSADNDASVTCTFIFDREAYEPAFFGRLWDKYRIAIITYRKNVKDKWPADCFKNISLSINNQNINMHLCEQNISLAGYDFREIRRLNENEHQTSILTNHPTLPTAEIAGRMFSRWAQENFFRYLIQDYDFDKMVSFGVETIDPEKEVVNPQYRRVSHQIKKLREKIQRLEARFYPLVELAIEQPLDALPTITTQQIQYKTQIDYYKEQEAQLLNIRSQIKPRLKIKEMPPQQRYNKLKTESKLLMNVIKMICYRAETSVAQWIAPYLANAEKEKRMVVKQIINSSADISPDYQHKTLTITLHGLSANRYNQAALALADLLNQTETYFPGTDLKMIFKISALPNC